MRKYVLFAIGLLVAILARVFAPNKMPPLLDAASKGKTETVQRLIDKGADVNAAPEHVMTALELTADRGAHRHGSPAH